jgi:hypothetical protein
VCSFTDEDDRLLRYFLDRLGHKWAAIAKHFPGRTNISLKNRARTLQKRDLQRSAATRVDALTAGENAWPNPDEVGGGEDGVPADVAVGGK